MAKRRMFSSEILLGDPFLLDLSDKAKALYIIMLAIADDDGIVNNLKTFARILGAEPEHVEELKAARFIYDFEGVYVVKHWRIHNSIRADRYHATKYTEILDQLAVKDNGAYTLAALCQPNDNQLATETRQDKARLGKTRQDKTPTEKGQKNEISAILTANDWATLALEYENPLGLLDLVKVKNVSKIKNPLAYMRKIANANDWPKK